MRSRSSRPIRILKIRIRRFVSRIDRRAAALFLLIPSWGASLLVHGIVILLLALIIYARGRDARPDEIQGRFASQLTEDLTSLNDSDRAGDPFTRIQTEEPPSLSVETDKKEVLALNQPDLNSLERFATELSSPAPSVDTLRAHETIGEAATKRFALDAGAKGLGAVVSRLHTEDMTAPFSGRDALARSRLVRREGGTIHSEKAVEAGLNWLVRHQRPDGGWSLNFHDQCKGAGCPESQRPSIDSDTAATGLALLPLLGAGHIHTSKSRYQTNVREGLGWLMTHQSEEGELYLGGGGFPGGMARMYSHAIATMALCEAYGLSRDPGLRPHAQRAIDFIVAAQNSLDGGWRYTPGQAGDTSVFGWQMFAIRSARLSGLRVPKTVLKGCKTYLDLAAADGKKVTYAYQPGRAATPVMTAEALLSRQYLGWPHDYPALVKGASMVAADLLESPERNIYYWYYATQLLHNMQNKDWERWNVKVRDGLVAMQSAGNGCDSGSWDPFTPATDRWAASSGGRLFLTSLSILTLEVYYRYLPLYQPTDVDKLKDLDDKDDPKPPAAPTG